jgi:hypothetical protein
MVVEFPEVRGADFVHDCCRPADNRKLPDGATVFFLLNTLQNGYQFPLIRS